ncbi:MAG TPA: hypothetical protein VF054_12540 [Micromonosporaceae bacterium]
MYGFKYFDVRDLLGFVDGTENPVGAKAAAPVLIGDDVVDGAVALVAPAASPGSTHGGRAKGRGSRL